MIKYPYTDFHEMNLDWTIETAKKAEEQSAEAVNTSEETKEYVDNYFENLDVQEEVNVKVDELVDDGTFSRLITEIYGDEVNLKFAATTADMTDITSNYVLTTDSHVYYYDNGAWIDSGIVYGAVNSTTYMYRGAVDTTTFAAKTEPGFYSFTTAQLSSITDKPSDITSGGVLRVEKYAAAGVIMQTLFNTRGETWFRHSTNPFVRVIQPMVMRNAGQITSGAFSDYTTTGYYYYTTASISNFSDAPADLIRGGTLFVYASGTGAIQQMLVDSQGNMWTRNGTNPFVNIASYLGIRVNNVLNNYGEITSGAFSDYSNYGFYFFRTANLANFSDAPADLVRGGTLFVYRSGTGVIQQMLVDTQGNMWTRHSTNPFVNLHTLYGTNVKWYALGDSITEGYYSENGIIAGVTSNNWVANVANLNDYTVINYGVGGSGYIHPATVGDGLNARQKVDTISFTDADLVTLSFGVNDWHYNMNIGS